MAETSGHRIDWQRQFSALDPFAREKGGVVHVNSSEKSPTAAFAKVLRIHLEKDCWPKPWRTVQIQPINADTHYLEDVVKEISRSANAPLGLHQRLPDNVHMLNDVDAGGHINIKDVRVSVNSEFPVGELVEALCVALRERLETHRVAIIFLESHEFRRAELNGLFGRLWQNGLANLISAGLLVIDIFDSAQMSRKNCSWPPDADALLELAATYGEEDRKDAHADLVNLATTKALFTTSHAADAFAETLLSSSLDVRAVHMGLARTITRLGGSNGHH